MSEQGAALQTYNQELVKGIENLKIRRSDLMAVITEEEAEKAKLEEQLALLSQRLSTVTESLNQKFRAKSEYDRAIETAESAYMKILESSQALLNVVNQESLSLNQAPKMKAKSS